MHVSLTPELESMVKDRVQTGMYNNGSELIRAALRTFFHVSDEKDYIRNIVAPRLDAVEAGTADLQDFDDAMNEIEQDVFKSSI